LTGLRDSLSAQNEELRSENLDLAKRFADLESAHAAKTCELLGHQDELSDRLHSSLSKLSTVEQHLDSTVAELSALKNLEVAWNLERKQFEEASHSASLSVQDLSVKLEHAEDSLRLLNAEHEAQIKALEHELVQTRAALADEVLKTSELAASASDYESRFAQQSEEISAAHLRLDALQSDLAKVSKHRDQLSAAHDFLVGLRDSITQQNEELRSKVDSLEHVKSELESQLRQITAEVEDSAQRNAELAKLNIDLQRLVDNSEQHLAFLKDLFIKISTTSMVRSEPTLGAAGRSD
jgi:chromosome segregation ATPase